MSEQQRVRVGEQELEQPLGQRPVRIELACDHVVPDERCRLVHPAHPAHAGLHRGVDVGDVVAEVDELLLDAARVERVHAGQPQTMFVAHRHDPVERMPGLVGRRVQLPAELADVGDPRRAAERAADLDVADRAEGERLVGEILPGDGADDLAASSVP